MNEHIFDLNEINLQKKSKDDFLYLLHWNMCSSYGTHHYLNKQ